MTAQAGGTVKDFMHRYLEVVSQDTTIVAAAERMGVRLIGSVLVESVEPQARTARDCDGDGPCPESACGRIGPDRHDGGSGYGWTDCDDRGRVLHVGCQPSDGDESYPSSLCVGGRRNCGYHIGAQLRAIFVDAESGPVCELDLNDRSAS